MAKKAPRRTAQRILENALDLFNRFGEPNVSTTLIAAHLAISPGNLYYHYPTKDKLINRLLGDYESELEQLLHTALQRRDARDAARFLNELFELIWRYRFFYRDLNNLLSNNRHLETQFLQLLSRKEAALKALLENLFARGHLLAEALELDALARSMGVLLTYWFSYEYASRPREAMEPEHAEQAMARGSRHTLLLLAPYLTASQRQALENSAAASRATAARSEHLYQTA